MADGLTAFAPLWALAALFSIAGDYGSLAGHKGMLYAVPAWAVVVQSLLLIARPRATALLVSLSATVVLLYALRAPVASNNQTITTVMDLAILLSAGYLYFSSGRTGIDRIAFYEQIRIVARALLAIMYFYGIFHKINTDFLDPTVSCAVGLYQPLASPFGLEDNLFGRYLAIYSTFVIEAIAIVALYWRRFFAVGFILALVFHYIIPISAYSWYMDFSCLVFALYILSIPRPVSAMAQHTIRTVLAPARARLRSFETLLIGAVLLAVAAAIVMTLHTIYPDRSLDMLRHSVGILLWAVIGGALMVILTNAALHYLPYTGPAPARQPRWLFAIPVLFFLSCLSPYLGLKTESSINMFSNLHTEGGETNHLLFDRPPYLFDYQNDIVRIVDANDNWLEQQMENDQHLVLFALKDYLRRHPDAWVTYELNGQTVERATSATFADQQPGLIERNLLRFKTVDYDRPKVCTH
ncbi:thiol-disulfide oxidoreductase [Paracoccus rhizosphaerae]|uniref:Thiol-disulfide oxidoreductase n=1 Tax=Paracoccus rhizosphaerae TaxID=1133347 RepID=A0ABV6CDU7_9RHOB|nr:thiol-disulfide oxidoreductase [Paracoccus rhizosphaerae]